MGAEGTGILQHDLAMDVVDLFFEQFDRNVPSIDIAESLELQLGYADLDDAEKQVLCGAMIECLWRIGVPTNDYEQKLRGLDGRDAIRQYWGDGLARRTSAIRRLLQKVQVPKSKPRKPKIPGKTGKPAFSPGDYVAYERNNGRYVPIILWGTENAFGMEYYFALPNLSRVSDQSVIDRFLGLDASLTGSELAMFFNTNRRFRIVGVKARLVAANASRFRRFGNKPFPPPGWTRTGASSAESMDAFERQINGNGSRSLSESELGMIAFEQNLAPERKSFAVPEPEAGTNGRTTRQYES